MSTTCMACKSFLKSASKNVPIFNISSIMAWFWYIMLWLAFYFHVRFKKYFLVFTMSSDSAEHDNKSYLHFNPPRVIHLLGANIHAAAAILDPKPYSTLVQKKICARKAPRYTFPRIGMYVPNNIFHNLSRVLNQLKPITKVMDVFTSCETRNRPSSLTIPDATGASDWLVNLSGSKIWAYL